MFKKIIVLAIALLVIASTGMALAQDTTESETTTSQDEIITAQDLGVSEPNILPNSKFYFLKNWGNAIRMALTFGVENKATLNLKIASEKLLEAQKLTEKTSNPQILEKATTLYNKQMKKMQENIAKFKGNATSSEKVSKFLDKYTKQQMLHTQILEKLEGKVSSSTMEKMVQNREQHMEQFGEVMQKLEDKTQIQTRLQKGLDSLRNTDLKEIKNLEILEQIKARFPSSTQEQVQQSIENGLLQLREKLQLMPLEKQEKVEQYIEKLQGSIEKKMEMISNVKNALPSTSSLRNRMDALKIRIQNQVQSKNNQQIVGGDKDEHGCLGSAGYTWCEEKEKCLRVWEEPCETQQNQGQEQNQGTTTQNQEQNKNQVQTQQGQQ